MADESKPTNNSGYEVRENAAEAGGRTVVLVPSVLGEFPDRKVAPVPLIAEDGRLCLLDADDQAIPVTIDGFGTLQGWPGVGNKFAAMGDLSLPIDGLRFACERLGVPLPPGFSA